MYIVVKFGDQETALFNPYCRTVSLLADIKQRCHCKEEVDVELSDETGNVKNLRDSPTRYANELLEERGTFVLLRVEKSVDSDTEPNYVPLLRDSAAITESFLARLSSGKEERLLTVNMARRRSSITPGSGRRMSIKETSKIKNFNSGKLSPTAERRSSKSKAVKIRD